MLTRDNTYIKIPEQFASARFQNNRHANETRIAPLAVKLPEMQQQQQQ